VREIKFRVWSKTRQEMIYPMFGWFKKVYIGDNGFLQDIQLGTAIELNGTKLELLQYTGLKDKNGMEIYEGDIVNVNHYGGTPRFEKVEYYTVAGFASVHPFTDSGHHWSSHNCEIVGNIYENPELLTA
jgi:uncharacterized phage protein (TIGR01671 family)